MTPGADTAVPHDTPLPEKFLPEKFLPETSMTRGGV
jgi:hypothetical protein